MRVDTAASPVEFRGRSRCMKCDGTGIAIELRVVWSVPRDGMPPEKHWRRVASEEFGLQSIDVLRAEGIRDAELLSGAGPCVCRKQSEMKHAEPKPKPKPVGRPHGKTVPLDWKTICAGGD